MLSSLLSLGFLSVLFAFNKPCACDELPTTWTLSSETLSTNDRDQYVAYDADYDSDSIYILGGSVPRRVNGRISYRRAVYRYNISEDSLAEIDSKKAGYSHGRPNSVFVGGVIYYGGRSDRVGLYAYDVETGSNKQLLSYFFIDCLTNDPDHPNLLYFLNILSGFFYVYDVDTNTYFQGKTLKKGRSGATCIVSKYNQHNDDNTAYLYAILGQQTVVERVNVNSQDLASEKWKLMTADFDDLELETDPGGFIGIPFGKYIFLFGGRTSTTDDMIYYDTQEDRFGSLGYGGFPNGIIRTNAVLAQNNRIYAIGGHSLDLSQNTNTIYYSNELQLTDDSVNYASCEAKALNEGNSGKECYLMREGVGCVSCRPFYDRVLVKGLYECLRNDNATQEEVDYACGDGCQSDNCLHDENPNCQEQKSWGCKKCFDDYFRKDNDHLCVECSMIPNCRHCNSNSKEWGGCDICNPGYRLQWDFLFGYKRCEAK